MSSVYTYYRSDHTRSASDTSVDNLLICPSKADSALLNKKKQNKKNNEYISQANE
jgi:hypothetical protein